MSKIILITGASKGIGKAIALNLYKDHSLALFARSQEKLNELKKLIIENGGKCITIVGDVTNEQDVARAINETVKIFGSIDCLINNAGIGLYKRVDEFSKEEFQKVLDVNVLGPFLMTKYAVPHMISNKQGQIINISSVAGLNGFKQGSAYSASKFALNGFTESIREDLKDYGIAVTSVCPGGVRTEFGGGNPEKPDRPFLLEPEDVAHSIEYLVNESETANTKLIELKPRKRKEKR